MKEKLVLGVDPGISGAWVLLKNNQPIEWGEMPTMKVGTATRVNATAFARNFSHYNEFTIDAFVEQVHAMPGQGVTAMFTFGHSCGVISGVLGALHIPVTMVTPQAWKKRAGLIGKDKDAARSRAIEIWPHWRDLDKKIKGQALADAALIALYG